jgi:hypothetical protein
MFCKFNSSTRSLTLRIGSDQCSSFVCSVNGPEISEASPYYRYIQEDENQLKADRGQFVFSVFVNILSVANSTTEVK